MIIPDGGAKRLNRASRLTKLATNDAGKCVEAKKVSRSLKKRERCLEWSMLESRRE